MGPHGYFPSRDRGIPWYHGQDPRRNEIRRRNEKDRQTAQGRFLGPKKDLDKIPGGTRFVAEMKKIGRLHKAVFLDPKKTWKEKVKEMMKIAKDTLPKGLLAFGRFGLKVAVETGLPLVIAYLGK